MPTTTIELALAVVTITQARAVVAAVAAGVGLLVLVASYRPIRQTTLISAWWWSLAAVASWGAVECWFALRPAVAVTATGEALRLAAITLSLCPAMSLMGAKRPQDRAWNFVVLALLAVLLLPVAETLLLHPGQRPNFGGARSWFPWAPIFLGLVGYLPTRYWLAASLAAAGQIIVFSPYLALIWRPLVPDSQLAGFVGVTLGLAVAGAHRGRHRSAGDCRDRLWIDFRDTFGLFWALRVQERINAMSSEHQWHETLYWHGFEPRADGDTRPAEPAGADIHLESTFRGLLRRFVTPTWIAIRGQKPPRPAENEAA